MAESDEQCCRIDNRLPLFDSCANWERVYCVMEWGGKKKSKALRSHDMIAYSYFPWLSVTQLGPRSALKTRKRIGINLVRERI